MSIFCSAKLVIIDKGNKTLNIKIINIPDFPTLSKKNNH